MSYAIQNSRLREFTGSDAVVTACGAVLLAASPWAPAIVRMTLGLVAALVVPGHAVLSLVRVRPDGGAPAQIAMRVAMSLVTWALLLVVLGSAGVRLTQPVPPLAIGGLVLLLAVVRVVVVRDGPADERPGWRPWLVTGVVAVMVAALSVAGLRIAAPTAEPIGVVLAFDGDRSSTDWASKHAVEVSIANKTSSPLSAQVLVDVVGTKVGGAAVTLAPSESTTVSLTLGAAECGALRVRLLDDAGADVVRPLSGHLTGAACHVS